MQSETILRFLLTKGAKEDWLPLWVDLFIAATTAEGSRVDAVVEAIVTWEFESLEEERDALRRLHDTCADVESTIAISPLSITQKELFTHSRMAAVRAGRVRRLANVNKTISQEAAIRHKNDPTFGMF